MALQPSKITADQGQKILKALAYSAGSGFVGGLLLTLGGILSPLTQGGQVTLDKTFLVSLAVGALVGGVVGAINALAVTVKQLFTPAE